MAKQNQNQKKQETKKRNKKMTRPNSLPLLPPLGCAILFFFVFFFVFLVSWFCGFLFSGSLLVFLQWLNKTKIQKTKKTQKKHNDQTQLSATTPPFGCAILCFCVFLFFGFLVFFVFCVLVRCWFFEGLRT